MKSLVIVALLSCAGSLALAGPKMEMHRVQAATKDPSGWYLAVSTRGAFSVLIPIPFNDFTVTEDDPAIGKTESHTVGAKSVDGVKFSATELAVTPTKPPPDLAMLPQRFQKPGDTVSEIDTSLFAGYPSVAFSVRSDSGGAFVRYVKTHQSLITVILEYPAEQAKAAEELRRTFLSSLKIRKT